ncbi:zinc finger CCCH domain-containing protein 14 [Juglans microcarpa x Juglans regia]|uniref:zinc finger CCCH domain-containing protein 14 n=1 Tax=Juglans microcarpa x Juglans regia TaxID=2249226 RepID=UPI001B7EC44B|nr:zinc finger CCCH domain-containing protein 14 [Juglans microcarpa x Juglans regia]XP_041003312.1 zinc finger CCCH domain-containing protein 14 [Juglans microcarpa x Juglans regia]
MDKDVSPPSNTGTITEFITSPPIASHDSIPPPPPSSSPDNTARFDYLLKNQNFGTDFASLYHSIFPPKSTSISFSPSTCCSSSINDDLNSDTIATQQRLNQARLILQYQELNSHYDLCCSRLLDLIAEADLLRQENAHLRIVNTELLKLLSSQASFHNLLLSSSTDPNHSFLHEFRRLSTEDEDSTSTTASTNRFDRLSSDRFSLPKSISVRSTGFTKPSNLPAVTHNSTPTRSFTRPRVPNQLASGSQKVYLSGKRVEEQEAMELEVYNQGMFKTELCNKWQESGTCPYGDHCQFAHGIKELRPVIRHPRYKTEVCRMVVAGGTCPYGHRCHFRHSLSEQEKLLPAPL